jgi:HK97 family phage major capsid protein
MIMGNPLLETIEGIGKTFDEFKKTNDQAQDELRKGNESRYRELMTKCDALEVTLVDFQKQQKVLERQAAAQRERVEVLEAINDRPGGDITKKLIDQDLKLFEKWIRSGGKDGSVTAEREELRRKAMAEYKEVVIGTALLGGNALPKIIGDQVDRLILRFSDILQNVRSVQVGSSDYQELVSIFGGNSGWVAETGSRAATGTPNLRTCKPTWGELYSYPQVSNWALQDIFFDVQSWLVNDIADGMSLQLATAIWNGNGTNKPTGMTNGAPVATADTASPMRAAAVYQFTAMLGFGVPSPSVITMDGIINTVYTLAPRYRAMAKFAMNTVTQGIIRRLKTSQGVYLWEPSLQIGQPDRLLGYPVFTWEDMGNGNVADALAYAFGDFNRAYLLTYRNELETTVENVTNPGYTRFYVRRRYGGIPLNNDAVKFGKNAD